MSKPLEAKQVVDLEKEQTEETKKKPFLSRYGINHPLLEYRSPFDRSPYPVIENIVRDTGYSFLLTFGIKAGLSLVSNLINIKSFKGKYLELITKSFGSGNVQLASAMGILTFMIKASIALLRIVRKKDDGWNGFVGGYLGGYLAMFLLKSKKMFITCFMLSRGIDTIYNSLSSRGHFKKKNIHWITTYAFMLAAVCYAHAHEPYLLDKGLSKSFDFVS